ncbi:MAG: hypothetical protein GEU95_00365 [Rhizobiales bacterium]|nr:hypothetical protein [Hyphomicrobiales bacterium]
MWKLALMVATAAAIAMLSLSTHHAGAESAGEKKIAVTCGGAIQNCPQGKKMYCNRWRPCKGRTAKVKRYCDQPICMTERTSKD